MKHRRTLVVPVLTAVFLTGVACSHTIPKSSSQPVPPPITSAVPSFTAMAKEDAPAPVSHVPVQVKTDLTPHSNGNPPSRAGSSYGDRASFGTGVPVDVR